MYKKVYNNVVPNSPLHNGMGKKLQHIHITMKVSRTQLNNKYDSHKHNIGQEKHDSMVLLI